DTFYARIVLRTRDNRELSIDSRPSDAIAVAVRMDCPIFVADEIMDNYAHVVTEEETQPSSESDDDEDLGAFKDFLSSLDI
ncbi:MAG: bifunctional nuclease family protein, partial [Thermoflexales bacterium]